MHTRGDRLAFSNGIVVLALVAGGLIYAFDGSVTRLIQLYILGVFTSFTLSQAGMVRHWNRALAVERDLAVRRRIRHSRAINAVGAVFTALVLVIVLATKFTHGAYLVVIAVPLLYAMMSADPPPLRPGQHRVGTRAARRGAARPHPRRGSGVAAAPTDAAGAGVRPGQPP